MKRVTLLATLTAALVACSLDVGPLGSPRIVLAPVLDSMFVGELLVKRQLTFYDVHGNVQDPGPVTWSSSDTTIISVDATTGRVTGRAPGLAAVFAQAQSAQGFAVVVVSPPLKVALLLDTLYFMPGDTLTVPVEVKHQAAGTPTVWFSAPSNGVFSIDSATGRVTAGSVGGPTGFVAHAALAPDTVTDSGTVQVVQLTDTTVGYGYYQIFGTAQRARRVGARASTFRRTGDTLTFQLHLPTIVNLITTETVDIVLRTPPAVAGTFAVDSISLAEASGLQFDPVCKPPRDWGQWLSLSTSARVQALSRHGGSISIEQIVPVTNGFAISGSFYLPAERTDFYNDPTAVLPIRGSFVAPLIASSRHC